MSPHYRTISNSPELLATAILALASRMTEKASHAQLEAWYYQTLVERLERLDPTTVAILMNDHHLTVEDLQ